MVPKHVQDFVEGFLKSQGFTMADLQDCDEIAMMSTEDIMDTLKLSRSAVWKLSRAGLLKPIKLNPSQQSRVIFRRRDVLQLLRSAEGNAAQKG